MGIQLIYIGKKSKNLYSLAEEEFTKRVKRYAKLEITQIIPSKNSASLAKEELLRLEAKMILDKMKDGSFLILLDENGKKFSSRKFAKNLQNILNHSPNICFVIGGAYGFAEKLKDQSNAMISLSELTFPHHLARLVFLEQLYRAYSILNNEPYHND